MPAEYSAQGPRQFRPRRGPAEVECEARGLSSILQRIRSLTEPGLGFGIEGPTQVGVEVPVGFETRRVWYSPNHAGSIGQPPKNL